MSDVSHAEERSERMVVVFAISGFALKINQIYFKSLRNRKDINLRNAMKPLKLGDFPKLKIKQYAQVQERETPEARYWRSFSIAREEKVSLKQTYKKFQHTFSVTRRSSMYSLRPQLL